MTSPAPSRTRQHRALAFIAALTAALTTSQGTLAAGLYFGDRGVRPLGRAGAFVAGADDLGAISYNPAGIYDAGTQFLFDGSWVGFNSTYTRQNRLRQVDPNTGETVGTSIQTYPTVQGTTPFLPIPTIAGSIKLNPKWVLGFGIWAPYATLTTYPDKVNGQPAPQRYALITLDGSLLSFVSAAVAFAPNKQWRIGASAGVLAGTFNAVTIFSGCVPERFICAPEDPNWDVLAQLNVSPIVAPAGQIGATFIPIRKLRAGLSVMLPVPVRSRGTLKTRLPAAPLFENAKQEGDKVSVGFNLPLILRGGVEVRPIDDLRLELGFDYQSWSMHQSIDVTPDHVALTDVAGFPKQYFIPPISLPRKFQGSGSVRLGGEGSIKLKAVTLDARAGASFESSAVPRDFLSVLTYDANKLTTALGASVHIGKVRIDATYAHIFPFNTKVDPANAKLPQVSPVAATPPVNPNHINGGIYKAFANIVGLGLAVTFDPAPAEFTHEAPPAPEAKPKKEPKAEPKKAE